MMIKPFDFYRAFLQSIYRVELVECVAGTFFYSGPTYTLFFSKSFIGWFR